MLLDHWVFTRGCHSTNLCTTTRDHESKVKSQEVKIVKVKGQNVIFQQVKVKRVPQSNILLY